MGLDFQRVNQAGLAACPGLLERILPGGRLRGKEYTCSDLSGGNGNSCSVNIRTGKWSDFATGEKGGDLVSLVAQINRVSQGEGLRLLAGMIGMDLPQAASASKADKPKPILPVPEGVAEPDMTHPEDGRPYEVYYYCDEADRLLGLTARYLKPGLDRHGKREKVVRPRVYTGEGWRWQGFDKPYPFYGLNRLRLSPADRPVIIVEGESKADVLYNRLDGRCPVLSIFGGSPKAAGMDCGPLAGRRVIIWPDNDEPGQKAALALHEAAKPAASVALLRLPDGKPETWDCKNAIEDDGWDFSRLCDFIAQNQYEPEERGKPQASGLVAVDILDFAVMQLKPREMLLAPVLPRQGLAMLVAERGIGKTFVALSIAFAVAGGGRVFGRWQAPKPSRVCYIDGEMPACAMQERILGIGAVYEPSIAERGSFTLITPDLQPDPMPNLATPAGQLALEKHIGDADLIILDNLATLIRGARSNDAESWQPVQEWLLNLRRQGKSVLLVHHAGKSGDQRGTSAREDVLDTTIYLRRPANYEMEEGCRILVHLAKSRGAFGDEVKDFEAWLKGNVWEVRDPEDGLIDQIRDLKAAGMNQREIGAELGISASKVCRLLKQ